MLNTACQSLIKILLPICQCLSRQSENQIEADVAEPSLLG